MQPSAPEPSPEESLGARADESSGPPAAGSTGRSVGDSALETPASAPPSSHGAAGTSRSIETPDGTDASDASGAPNEAQLGRRLAAGVVIGLLVYAAFVLWGDVGKMRAALANFDWRLVPAACALSFTNYLVRFLRWERYRRLLGVRLERGTSFLIFLAGLSLTVTPGKMGEAFKSWLVRRVDGSPIEKTAPIVLAERFTDLLAFLVLVAIGGLATVPEHAWIFWTTLGLCAVLLAVLVSRSLATIVVSWVARLPVVGGTAPKLTTAFDSTRVLLTPRELPLATLVSTLGWGLECVGFWLVANGLAGGDATGGIPLLFAIYAFALAAVAGAVVIISPGGLGVTEGTLAKMLQKRYVELGVAEDAALARSTSATLLIRLCTLWFAVGVGLVAWWAFERSRKRSSASRA